MKNFLTMLIIEDKFDDIELIQKSLSQSDNLQPTYVIANTLSSAINALSTTPIDIIILNPELPDSHGLETFRKINHHTNNPPIIIISALQDEEIETTAIREGAQDYLIKGSFKDAALMRSILYAIERKNSENTKKEYSTHLMMQFRVATALAESANLNNATQRILKSICEISKWQLSEVWAVDQTENTLRYVSSWSDENHLNYLTERNKQIITSTDEDIASHIWKTKTPCWIGDISQDRRVRNELVTQLNLKSCMGFPIIFKNEVIGIMLFFGNEKKYPDPNFAAMFTSIGSQIGTFIKRKRIEGDLLYLSHHDTLTGLANREAFEGSLYDAIAKAKHFDHMVAILNLNVDNFLKIKGEGKGDKLLQEVVKRLAPALRETDIISRFNGDEFTIVLSGIRKKENVMIIAKKILYVLSMPFLIDEKEFCITASIGISMFPDHSDDIQVLFKKADVALSYAKEKGGNNYQFFIQTPNIPSQGMIKLKNELHYALHRNEFILHYQPIVNVKNKNIVSVEALIRWHHPENGIIQPNDFVHLLEQNNLISSVGEWALRTACQQTKPWKSLGVQSVSVNISVHQLNMKILRTISKVLEETQMDPQNLVLELTEGTLMEKSAGNLYLLNAIKDLGVHLSIDDFGVGYSSLSYLTNFAVNSIKIDQSFISGIPTNVNSAAIVSAIVSMAQTLNIKTIAEGVETHEQYEFLKQIGCDEYQGFYFSHPLPDNDIIAVLTSAQEEHKKVG